MQKHRRGLCMGTPREWDSAGGGIGDGAQRGGIGEDGAVAAGEGGAGGGIAELGGEAGGQMAGGGGIVVEMRFPNGVAAGCAEYAFGGALDEGEFGGAVEIVVGALEVGGGFGRIAAGQAGFFEPEDATGGIELEGVGVVADAFVEEGESGVEAFKLQEEGSGGIAADIGWVDFGHQAEEGKHLAGVGEDMGQRGVAPRLDLAVEAADKAAEVAVFGGDEGFGAVVMAEFVAIV